MGTTCPDGSYGVSAEWWPTNTGNIFCPSEAEIC
jgi:hypothetical protein